LAKKPSRGKKKPPAEPTLERYLKEHVRYERDMLAFAHQQLHTTPEGAAWNLAYEGFCLHARNLAQFLRHEGDIRADWYRPGRPKPAAMPKLEALNQFLFHLSVSRLSKPKLTVHELEPVGAWLDREWAVFVDALPAPYKGLVDPSPVCGRLAFINGATPHTACSVVTATTIASPPTGPVLTILPPPPPTT
jgi:hypothetical protein